MPVTVVHDASDCSLESGLRLETPNPGPGPAGAVRADGDRDSLARESGSRSSTAARGRPAPGPPFAGPGRGRLSDVAVRPGKSCHDRPVTEIQNELTVSQLEIIPNDSQLLTRPGVTVSTAKLEGQV